MSSRPEAGKRLRRRPQLTDADMGADHSQKARHQDRAEDGVAGMA